MEVATGANANVATGASMFSVQIVVSGVLTCAIIPVTSTMRVDAGGVVYFNNFWLNGFIAVNGGTLVASTGILASTVNVTSSGTVVGGGVIVQTVFNLDSGSLTLASEVSMSSVTITTFSPNSNVQLYSASSGATFNILAGTVNANTSQHMAKATINAGAQFIGTDAPQSTFVVAGTLTLAPTQEGYYNVTVLSGGVANFNGPTANGHFYAYGRLTISRPFSSPTIFARRDGTVVITAALTRASITVDDGGTLTMNQRCTDCTFCIFL